MAVEAVTPLIRSPAGIAMANSPEAVDKTGTSPKSSGAPCSRIDCSWWIEISLSALIVSPSTQVTTIGNFRSRAVPWEES